MRAPEPRSRVGHERWLISYADFITLLFGLFVVLYAFARADHKTNTDVRMSIDSAFRSMGLLSLTGHIVKPEDGDVHTPVSVVMGEEIASPERVRSELMQMEKDLEQRLPKKDLEQKSIVIKMGRDGLVVSLREAGFFSSGSAIPRPEVVPVLREIAASMEGTAYELRIEGHTDNVPIHTSEFESNWELSAARATHVARLTLSLNGVEPQRVSAAGYGEFHPIDSNDTEQGRANNRRVDLVIRPRSAVDLRIPPKSSGGAWQKITDGD